MSDKRYTEEFKSEAIKQITERGHSIADVSNRLGVTTHSLYAWLKKYGHGPQHAAHLDDQQTEIRRLKAMPSRQLLR